MKITVEPTVKPRTGAPANTLHVAVSVEHPYDDLNMEEFAGLCRAAARAFGYAPETVAEFFGEDE